MAKESRDISTLAHSVVAGDVHALSRSITLVESLLASDRAGADELIEICSQQKREAHRIAITGVPGVGKSTFIEKLGLHYIAQGKKVAVLAIDPSSNRTSGSILGDKTRMDQLSSHPKAFIRPSAAAKTLGGVARNTREAMVLCEAAGFDIIIVETVGVGQSETTVRGMVDTFLLLMLAGAGDELQGIKRGIMEMADILLVNKVEEDNLAKAREARSEYSTALHMMGADEYGWSTKVGMVSALTGFQIEEAYGHLAEHFEFLKTDDRLQSLRRAQDLLWFDEVFKQGLVDRFFEDSARSEAIRSFRQSVADGSINPHVAARKALLG